MVSFPVARKVDLQGSCATLTLDISSGARSSGPGSSGPDVTMARPTTESILAKIERKEIHVHETRLPITKKAISNAMNKVQHALTLRPGMNRDWTPQAQIRLETLLQKPLIKWAARVPLLAIEDKDASNAAPLAIKDASFSLSSSDSDSSSSPDSPDTEVVAMDPGPSDVNQALAAKEVELNKAKEDFESAFSAMAAFQSDLEDAKNKLEVKQVEMALLQEKFEKTIQEKDAEIASLRQRLSDLEEGTS